MGPGLSAGPLGQSGNRVSQGGRFEGTGHKRQLRTDVWSSRGDLAVETEDAVVVSQIPIVHSGITGRGRGGRPALGA